LVNPSAKYEAAVFLSFLIATVMGILALITGVFSWWINYDFSMSRAFVIKLIGALFTLVVGLIPIVQKMMNPDVPFSMGLDGIIYHAVIFITVISITIVGYYGGKITWRAKA
ncbi:MAG TPA: 2-oxoacid:acceptor oxidoreductase subunit alpha, partial [Sulfuricurvum sp.]|nr:2-oxoacid:acceptor oxidoreductase subunit alpha [Sulfuricurvum sp.]